MIRYIQKSPKLETDSPVPPSIAPSPCTIGQSFGETSSNVIRVLEDNEALSLFLHDGRDLKFRAPNYASRKWNVEIVSPQERAAVLQVYSKLEKFLRRSETFYLSIPIALVPHVGEEIIVREEMDPLPSISTLKENREECISVLEQIRDLFCRCFKNKNLPAFALYLENLGYRGNESVAIRKYALLEQPIFHQGALDVLKNLSEGNKNRAQFLMKPLRLESDYMVDRDLKAAIQEMEEYVSTL